MCSLQKENKKEIGLAFQKSRYVLGPERYSRQFAAGYACSVMRKIEQKKKDIVPKVDQDCREIVVVFVRIKRQLAKLKKICITVRRKANEGLGTRGMCSRTAHELVYRKFNGLALYIAQWQWVIRASTFGKALCFGMTT